ncbi:hypothetical protein ES705_16957 [subsurface metagenome]
MTISTIAHKSPVCQGPPASEVGLPKLPPAYDESSPSPLSTAHHNALSNYSGNIYSKRGIEVEKRYGVPQTYRILTMGNYHKHHDDINTMLRVVCGLENRERVAIFCLFRLFLYYGKVYPKAADVADQEYISKRTVWRAIGKLRDLGVVEVINRYVKHKQISNLYRLDKLVVMIARFISEHHPTIFGHFGDKLTSFFRSFWDEIWDADINLSLGAPVKFILAGAGGV